MKIRDVVFVVFILVMLSVSALRKSGFFTRPPRRPRPRPGSWGPNAGAKTAPAAVTAQTVDPATIVVDSTVSTAARAVLAKLSAEDFAGADAELDRLRSSGRMAGDYVSAYVRVVDVIADVSTLSPVLKSWCAASPRSVHAHLLRGVVAITLAWQARGGGWAAEVTDQGWKGFEGQLGLAKKELETVATLDPTEPRAGSKLVRVAMGLSLGPGEEDRYLELAKKADPDFTIAYEARLNALKPRWGGSNSVMFSFARESAAARPNEPALGILVVEAHEDYAEYTAGNLFENYSAVDAASYLNDPKVKAEIDAALDALLARYPRAINAYSERSDVAALAGDEAGAVEWLKRGAAAGSAACCDSLGDRYRKGHGVKPDDHEALRWFQKAAEAGDEEAEARVKELEGR